MSTYIDRVFGDLQALGALGGSDLEGAVSRLLPAFGPTLRSRLMEAFTELSAELSEQIPGGRIDTRFSGDEIEFVFAPESGPVTDNPGELNARITLRLPDDLKARIEKAANQEGLSLNSWLLKASERGSYTINIPGKSLKGKGRS